MPDFRELLEEYGLDYGTTMERFMGNENLYRKMLEMFFQDMNFQKLGSALETQDYVEAFEAAHTLKGVAGNMGMTSLYNAVCAIVEPLRVKEDQAVYPALYQAIQTEYQKMLEMRGRLTGGNPV